MLLPPRSVSAALSGRRVVGGSCDVRLDAVEKAVCLFQCSRLLGGDCRERLLCGAVGRVAEEPQQAFSSVEASPQIVVLAPAPLEERSEVPESDAVELVLRRICLHEPPTI